MNIPEDLKYTRKHEWILIEEGVGTVGITDYAQSESGELILATPPKLGTRIEKDLFACEIEVNKAAIEIFAPVSGEVIEVNQELEEEPRHVNWDPYGKGWLFKVAVEDPEELDDLLDAADYAKLIDEET
ncbi:MAG: glycine cleavage system protein GcvH [Candidatus Eisenbacteria bacterium]